MNFAIDPGYKKISRAIIRRGGKRHVEMRRHAQHQVGIATLECLAEKSASLRMPLIFHFPVKLARDELCNFVFESLQVVVREWQIIRISSDSQHAFLLRERILSNEDEDG